MSVRERFAFAPEELIPALRDLRERFDSAAILSTCNRTEVYVAAPGEGPAQSDVVRALAEVRGEAVPEGTRLYHLENSEAARHLFRVAAGVESLVIGESEILGQVRAAFSAATAARSSDPALARLFHSAIRAGRRARSETGIGRSEVSVSSTAVALSRRALGDLRTKTVLVVGAGEAASLVARSLKQGGAGRVLVTTRTFERAQDIARELSAIALPFEERYSALAEADIAITSTSAHDFIIDTESVAAVMARRRERSLVIVDIAVPRDVEPAVGAIEGVRLFDIDDLQATVEANLEMRRGEIAAVERIVEEELGRFQSWLGSLSAVPTIAAIQKRAEAARATQVERTLARLPGLSDADRRRIEAMSKSLVKRLLHAPLNGLKGKRLSERNLQAARDLFALDDLDIP